MPLSERQLAFYKDAFDIWRIPSLPTDANGSVTTPQYALVEESVPARHQSTFHHNNVGPLGRGQDDNMMTEDVMHFEASVEIHDSDLLVKRNGNQEGTCYQVMGLPELRESAGGRDANYNHAKCRKCRAPKEVLDHYA